MEVFKSYLTKIEGPLKYEEKSESQFGKVDKKLDGSEGPRLNHVNWTGGDLGDWIAWKDHFIDLSKTFPI